MNSFKLLYFLIFSAKILGTKGNCTWVITKLQYAHLASAEADGTGTSWCRWHIIQLQLLGTSFNSLICPFFWPFKYDLSWSSLILKCQNCKDYWRFASLQTLIIMDHRQFTIIAPSRYLKLELFGTATPRNKPSLGFHSPSQIELMCSNFYGHRLEHVISPALSALLLRRSAVPRFSAVSVLVRCLTESSLWSLALIPNVCSTFRMIASMTTLYFALLCHMQSQETSSWRSNLYIIP